MRFRDIRHVRRDGEAFVVELDLEVDGRWEAAEYVVRRGGGGICDSVYDEIQRGRYRGTITPFVRPAPTRLRTIKVSAFRARFTRAERIQLIEAANTDAELMDFLFDVHHRTSIDLDNSQVLAGVDALVDRGLITPARRDELLADVDPAET